MHFYFPQIKVRPTVREVVATYTIDEGSTELVMILPPNYPYSDVEIESTKRVGVSAETWKKWMLQLRTFLLVSIRRCACIYIRGGQILVNINGEGCKFFWALLNSKEII